MLLRWCRLRLYADSSDVRTELNEGTVLSQRHISRDPALSLLHGRPLGGLMMVVVVVSGCGEGRHGSLHPPPRWVLHGAEEVRQGGDTTLNGPPMWFSRRQELSYAFSFATVSWRQILRGCCIHSAHFCLLSPPPTRLLPFSTCVAASVTKPLRDATDFLTNSAEMKPYPAEDCLHTAAGKRSVHSRTGLRVCPV